MLTKECAIAAVERGMVRPHRLRLKEHPQYEGLAAAMLRLYAEGVGRRRHELHAAVEEVFAAQECHPHTVRAFQELLDKAGRYEAGRQESASLRQAVFGAAAKRHPLVRRDVQELHDSREEEVKAGIAAELGRPWKEIEADLFADFPEFRRLESFDGFEGPGGAPRALLSRYNVAQVEVALYNALEVRVRAGTEADLKTIVRHAKLADLVHTISPRQGGGYDFLFDGPASLHDEGTTRYGPRLARLVAPLLTCADWSLEATIRRAGTAGKPDWHCRLLLSPADRLRGHLPSAKDYDSQVEEKFFEKWGEGQVRGGWSLRREGSLLVRGQTVFTPDFTLFHKVSGRTVYLEIVGFWTPRYLEHKRRTAETFQGESILWAVGPSGVAAFRAAGIACVAYKSGLILNEVLAALEIYVGGVPP